MKGAVELDNVSTINFRKKISFSFNMFHLQKIKGLFNKIKCYTYNKQIPFYKKIQSARKYELKFQWQSQDFILGGARIKEKVEIKVSLKFLININCKETND